MLPPLFLTLDDLQILDGGRSVSLIFYAHFIISYSLFLPFLVAATNQTVLKVHGTDGVKDDL